MNTTLLLNANIVNEGKTLAGDVLIKGSRIERVEGDLSSQQADSVIDLKVHHGRPSAVDDRVQFGEPRHTHKATMYSGSRAAVAGEVTSFMDMPNTVPPVFLHSLSED